MVLFFGPKTCGMLTPQLGIEPPTPALEGEVLTTGLPGKSPKLYALESRHALVLKPQCPAHGRHSRNVCWMNARLNEFFCAISSMFFCFQMMRQTLPVSSNIHLPALILQRVIFRFPWSSSLQASLLGHTSLCGVSVP